MVTVPSFSDTPRSEVFPSIFMPAGPAAVKTTGETRYVYYRKPYTVRLPGGKVIGDFATRKEAEAACLAALAERSGV